jgi:hypothetical protein
LNHGFRDARLGHHHTAPVVNDHAVDGLRAGFHLEIFGQGVADVMVALGIQDVRTPNAFRPCVGIRINQDGIDNAENCGGRTDT